MARILVSGGCGFIGSNLIEKLLKNNDVFIIDNFNDFYNPKLKERNWNQMILFHKQNNLKTSIFLIKEDIFNIFNTILDKEKYEIDYVIHLAALAGVRESALKKERYYKNNIKGTEIMLKFAKKKNVKKFINFSSSSVYGNQKTYPVEETFPLNPISPYALSKMKAEEICDQYSNDYSLPIITLRPFTVYGPRQRPKMAVNNFFNKISRDKEIMIYGNGKKKRDFTFIEDLTQAVQSCIKIEMPAKHEILNIGSGRTITINNLVKEISKIVKKKPKINYQPDIKEDVNITHASIKKAKKLINYKPKFTITKGLKKYWDWLKSNQS